MFIFPGKFLVKFLRNNQNTQIMKISRREKISIFVYCRCFCSSIANNRRGKRWYDKKEDKNESDEIIYNNKRENNLRKKLATRNPYSIILFRYK